MEESNKIGNNDRIKFVETSGRKYIDKLKISDPFKNKCLPEDKCFVCKSSKENTNCKGANVGDRISCKLCKKEVK